MAGGIPPSSTSPADASASSYTWPYTRITAINPDNNRLAARRLHDNILAVFDGGYVRAHITHGSALTAHSAQGATADTTHAVLSETATRALSYVAMTRGRDANTAYLYGRISELEYGQAQSDAVHVPQRGTSHDAARIALVIVAGADDEPVTAHSLAAEASKAALPEPVRSFLHGRAAAAQRRHASYRDWRSEVQSRARAKEEARGRHAGQSRDCGIEM